MLTNRQRERRAKSLGGSDCPAVLGVSPWMTRYELYVDKTAGLPDKEGSHLDAGNLLESALLAYAGRELGKQVTIKNRFRVHENGFMHANLDGLVVKSREGIECKVVSAQNSYEWGDAGTNQVPDYVQAQAHHQMYVAELDVVWVPALIVRLRPEFRLYKLERNKDLIDVIVRREEEFWNRHVLPQVPPDDQPTLEALKYLRREPGKVVEIQPELVEQWEAAKAEALAAKKQADEMQRRLIAALGDAEGGNFGDANKMVTYLESERAAYEVAASKYRTLRISKKG